MQPDPRRQWACAGASLPRQPNSHAQQNERNVHKTFHSSDLQPVTVKASPASRNSLERVQRKDGHGALLRASQHHEAKRRVGAEGDAGDEGPVGPSQTQPPVRSGGIVLVDLKRARSDEQRGVAGRGQRGRVCHTAQTAELPGRPVFGGLGRRASHLGK